MDNLTALVEQALCGSSAAMEEFVSLSYNDVRRLCAALVDEASANDLTQETFLRVVRHLSRFRQESSARTWILSIAHNVCIDELRDRTRIRRHRGNGRQEETHSTIEPDCSEAVCVVDILSGLDPDRRAAFVITQMFGISYTEAATMLGCAPGTVASRVSRARSELIVFMGARHNRQRGRA